MESMGGGGSAARPAAGVRSDRQLRVSPDRVARAYRPRGRGRGEAGDRCGMPREPRLKGDDTILLSLEMRRVRALAPEIEERERAGARSSSAATGPAAPTQPAIPGQQQATAQPNPRCTRPGRSATRIERTEEEISRLKDFRERVLRRNPYKLDKWGILNVAELGPIPLAGLDGRGGDATTGRRAALAGFHRRRHAPAAASDRHRGAQAVRLRPVRRHDFDVRAGDRCAGAGRVRRRTRRHDRSAADRQHQGPLLAGRRPRRPSQFPGARSDRRQRPALRGDAQRCSRRASAIR